MKMTCENLRICGEGTIYGGGNELGTEMKKLYKDKLHQTLRKRKVPFSRFLH
jgi:hypothetical protein